VVEKSGKREREREREGALSIGATRIQIRMQRYRYETRIQIQFRALREHCRLPQPLSLPLPTSALTALAAHLKYNVTAELNISP